MSRITGLPTYISSVLVKKHLNVREGENVLITTDTETDMEFAYALSSACTMAGAEVTLLTIPPTFLQTRERPLTKSARMALQGADLYIPMTPTTGRSIHDVEISRLVGQKKLRDFVLARYHAGSVDILLKSLREHDYERVYDLSKKVALFLSTKKQLRLNSDAGTDLTASIQDVWAADKFGGPFKWAGGIVKHQGEVGGLPDGEAWGGPREGTAEGRIVVNGPVSGMYVGTPSEPITLTLVGGKVTHIEGGKEAREIRNLIEKIPGFDNLAEISVGTNEFMAPTGNIDHGDKKIAGTVHIALGDNMHQIFPFGTVDCALHVDMLLNQHVMSVDGEEVVADGRLKIL